MENNPDQIKKIYYTIAEVSAMINQPTSTLRFWESQFEWIRPKRNRRGERRYKNCDIQALIDVSFLLNVAMLTMQGVIWAYKMNYYEELVKFISEKHKMNAWLYL